VRLLFFPIAVQKAPSGRWNLLRVAGSARGGGTAECGQGDMQVVLLGWDWLIDPRAIPSKPITKLLFLSCGIIPVATAIYK